MRYIITIYLVLATLAKTHAQSGVKIAFLADVHLQDIYGGLNDNTYNGIINPADGMPVLIRTMESQLHSTRIFNENYFAFIAALDDIASRGIKIVSLPGDYTDDGQPIHLRGLQHILQEYEDKYGINFFITTGNHDPVGPFAKHAGKTDFLGEGGKQQPIYSKGTMYKPNENNLPVVISSDIACMGYTGITEYLGNFGFMPKQDYLYWSTPFSQYTYTDYNFEDAKVSAALENREYEVTPGFKVPDASYVVEPVKGLWLLSIDGNTYIPKDSNGKTADSDNYRGADLGYNNVLSNKVHLINWVKNVAAEAKKHNKTLIAFSHYPMVDFNDGASAQIAQFMGKGKWQLDRIPVEAVAQQFADAGLTIHFGGHMHINDTGIHTTANGNTLLNVQTPSLAAYIPAYKLLTLTGDSAEVETITIDKVKGFDKLFLLYKMEYEYLQRQGKKDIWNKDILTTKSYHEFTDFHLKELVRLRFIPDDWHAEFAALLDTLSGTDLLLLANVKNPVNLNELIQNRQKFQGEWDNAEKMAKQKVKNYNIAWKNFSEWKGSDLILDFYRIRNADELALADIPAIRIAQYKLIAQCLATQNYNQDDAHQTDLHLLFSILNKFLDGEPANHFKYSLKSGKLQNIKQ